MLISRTNLICIILTGPNLQGAPPKQLMSPCHTAPQAEELFYTDKCQQIALHCQGSQ